MTPGGKILLQQSRLSQAKSLLLKVIRDPRVLGINPARIKARIDLAGVHLLEGAYSEGMNRLFEARDMSVESGYTEGEGLSIYYLEKALKSEKVKILGVILSQSHSGSTPVRVLSL